MSAPIELTEDGLRICREILAEECRENPEAMLKLAKAVGWTEADLLREVAKARRPGATQH